MKHTPGPWTISKISPLTGEQDMSVEFDGCPVCTVRGTNDMSCIDEEDESQIKVECLANARLIAAAPELLAAVKELHMINIQKDGVFYGLTTVYKKTEDLIVKAEGN